MDDLDRLYQHLVTTLRAEAPHLLRRRFVLGDVAGHLVPYRLHRRALGFDGIEQYERALLRLAAGERGLLTTDPVVQDAARQALAGETPAGDVLRRHADVPVALAPEALRETDLRETPVGESADVRDVVPPLEPNAAAATLPQEAPDAPPPNAPAAMPFPTRPPATVVGGPCRCCGQPLPEGRAVTFCPYCGQNVTVVRCPACSTELETGWRFCVTCGRAMDDAAAPPLTPTPPG